MPRTSLWLLAAALCQLSFAAPELHVGYYASTQGTSLVIDRADGASFHLVAYSPASLGGHCVVEGEATYLKGSREEADFQWAGCHYRVKATLGAVPVIKLRADNATCNATCGRKLYLSGQRYTYQYPGCAARQIDQRREEFNGLVAHKRFDDAYTTLAYTFDHCLTYLEGAQAAWVTADLAMAAFKKGDPKRCLQLLEGYRAPNEPVAQAMEIDRKLCQEATPRA